MLCGGRTTIQHIHSQTERESHANAQIQNRERTETMCPTRRRRYLVHTYAIETAGITFFNCPLLLVLSHTAPNEIVSMYLSTPSYACGVFLTEQHTYLCMCICVCALTVQIPPPSLPFFSVFHV